MDGSGIAWALLMVLPRGMTCAALSSLAATRGYAKDRRLVQFVPIKVRKHVASNSAVGD